MCTKPNVQPSGELKQIIVYHYSNCYPLKKKFFQVSTKEHSSLKCTIKTSPTVCYSPSLIKQVLALISAIGYLYAFFLMLSVEKLCYSNSCYHSIFTQFD